MAGIEVIGRGNAEFRKLQRRLQVASNGRELKKELIYEIRIGAAPAMADVRASVLSVDVQSSAGGGDSSGLRARIAAAVSVRAVASGVRIYIQSRKVDPKYGRSLARLMNNTNGRPWIHPLFGNAEQQFTQRGRDYFASAIRPHADDFRDAVLEAMAKVADKIRG
ncbi:hypothetical protein ABT341_00235 [Pseudonocardia alni]|uniref:hypothetical protein n=1 Tax=Pseudonocardia alni TaxID=33907 RepID=UPI00331A88D0